MSQALMNLNLLNITTVRARLAVVIIIYSECHVRDSTARSSINLASSSYNTVSTRSEKNTSTTSQKLFEAWQPFALGVICLQNNKDTMRRQHSRTGKGDFTHSL
jgi:hypothetical protein